MSEDVTKQNILVDYKGFLPTYQKLDSYDHLIDKAKNKTISYGDGDLDLSKELIKLAISENTNAVKGLAAHLKAATVIQSAFNVWHWIRENIYYVYDTYGIEEIRSPQRSYTERRGDCDCFTVFSCCLFRAMGLDCEAHIVTFYNKPCPSHIYAYTGGVVVDPVLCQFNTVPKGVVGSKTQKMKFYNTMNGLGEINSIGEIAKINILRPFMLSMDGLGGFEFQSPAMAGWCQLGYEMLNGIDGLGLIPQVQAEAYRQIQKGLYAAGIYNHPENMDYVLGYERLGGVDGLGGFFSDVWDGVSNAANKVADVTKSAVNTVVNKTADVVKKSTSAVMQATSFVNKTATGLVQKAADAVGAGNLIKPLTQATNWVTDAAGKAVTSVTNAVTNSWAWSTNAINDLAIKIGKATQQGLKWLGSKALTLFLAPARIAFLGLLKVNFCAMATKLTPGCHDEKTATELNYNMDVWKVAKDRFDRLAAFWGTMGGDVTQLTATILTAKDLLSFGLKGVDDRDIQIAQPILCKIRVILSDANAKDSFLNLVSENYHGIASKLFALKIAKNTYLYDRVGGLIGKPLIVRFEQAILAGKNKPISSDLLGLGYEPVSTGSAASVAAAAPILTRVLTWLKGVKMADLCKYIKEGSEVYKSMFGKGSSPKQVDDAQSNADALITDKDTKLSNPDLDKEFNQLTANYEGAANSSVSTSSSSSLSTTGTTNSIYNSGATGGNPLAPTTDGGNTKTYLIVAAAVAGGLIIANGSKKKTKKRR